jgi:UDP-glucuronate decarboxylase
MSELIVVTGGAGFLGSHVCDRLIATGARVIALDDFSTGHPSHVSQLEMQPHFALRRHDVADPWPSGLTGASRVFNLACPASPAYYQKQPVQTTLTSAVGMWQVLKAARESGARVLQTSTSEVYGDPQVHPQAESYHGHVNPIGPRACYDEGKRVAETLCFGYHLELGVEVRIARVFNSYGPRLRCGDGRVVSNFIVQALRGEPLTVYGSGEQTRSFCYVDDTVEGLLRMMESDIEGPINIGNPIEHTVLDLAERVLRLTSSRSRLERRPLPPDDPKRRCPDISRAKHHLQWEPKVSLDDGLRETIGYFRHELGLSPHICLSAPASEAASRGTGSALRSKSSETAAGA